MYDESGVSGCKWFLRDWAKIALNHHSLYPVRFWTLFSGEGLPFWIVNASLEPESELLDSYPSVLSVDVMRSFLVSHLWNWWFLNAHHHGFFEWGLLLEMDVGSLHSDTGTEYDSVLMLGAGRQKIECYSKYVDRQWVGARGRGQQPGLLWQSWCGHQKLPLAANSESALPFQCSMQECAVLKGVVMWHQKNGLL